LARCIGCLEPEDAAAHDDRAAGLAVLRVGPQPHRIVGSAQGERALEAEPLDGEQARAAAGGEHEPVVGELLTGAEHDVAGTSVDSCRARVQRRGDASVRVPRNGNRYIRCMPSRE